MDRFNWNHSTADYNSHDYYSQPYQEYGQSNDHNSQPYQGYGQSNDHYSQPYQGGGQSNDHYNDHYSQPYQGFGQSNDHYSQPYQGFGQSNDHYSQPYQGFGQSNDHYSQPYQGFGQSNDHYSQPYQEYGQHTSLFETGQTSGGVAASGPSWIYPTQGQPQPYQEYNFSQEIPPSLGSDFEYLLREPQPTPLANIIQNDVPSNAQPTAKAQRPRIYNDVKKEFLAGLDKYGQGRQLKDCSDVINFFSYITHDGELHSEGRKLYERFEQKDKERVDQAIADRKLFNALQPYSDDSDRTRIMEGLEAYANGSALVDCSKTIRFSAYFTTDGRMLACGKRLYKKLGQEDKDLIDQALADRKQNGDKVKTSFLEGLEAYANGAALKDCSKTIHFDNLVTTSGQLHERGKRLLKRLEQGDKDRVHDALSRRNKIHIERMATNDTPMDDFLGGLETYASGAPLKDCSTTNRLYPYATNDGRLRRAGERLSRRLEGGEGMALVNNALTTRKTKAAEKISGDLPNFLKALEPYSNGLDLQTCGEQSGLKKKAKKYFTPEGGLTVKGELLIQNLPLEEQLEVLNKVGRRKQSIDPSAQPVPESPSWQLPSSMLDMRGMNQDEMVDPMQTESMWAAAWQMTGQAVPGPSTSAEPPIPYYDSEAVGADYQRQLWSGTERTGPGESWPYADQYPW